MTKLTTEKCEELARLAQLPDSRIDLSDIPEIKNLPSDAVIGKFSSPRKTSVTIRLDADVLSGSRQAVKGIKLASIPICAVDATERETESLVNAIRGQN
jgi:uncharacterized protein (DUF4415 family)